MSQTDYKLLQQALEVLKDVRKWVAADYYRDFVAPTANRIRDHLAVIDAERMLRKVRDEKSGNKERSD